MYVVLQAIGSPSCMIIIYIIPFGEQQSWMSEVRKKQVPRNDFFLYIELKKWVFQAHRRVSPTTGVGKLWPNTYFRNESQ